jgi:hypothetical protein
MGLQHTTHDHGQDSTHRFHIDEKIRGALVVVIGSAGLVGLAFGAMLMLTSPDGWVMKAANQAMSTAQQGTLATYDIAFER